MYKIFIDGRAGTTGLKIYERLALRKELELMVLPEALRKDPEARRDALNSCDIAFLCLPDDAAREAVSLIENPDVVVLDTSTAHRTASGWAYGFPELSPAHRAAIARAKRIAVPGCHASGFIALIYPLIANNLLKKDALLACQSITGYSGGGKKMIAAYEAKDDPLLQTPRQYGLTQQHKHLPEMVKITGLLHTPAFSPVVSSYYSGMEVTVPLFAEQLLPHVTKKDIAAAYAAAYKSDLVFFRPEADEAGFYAAGKYSGLDCMELTLAGNEEILLPVARYDNLGKGASGAAIECMNIVLGLEETTGLMLA